MLVKFFHKWTLYNKLDNKLGKSDWNVKAFLDKKIRNMLQQFEIILKHLFLFQSL
jgi:hypothetical protein